MSDTEFQLGETEYRIARPDSFNLSIQRLGGKTWRNLSYHGSSLKSLAHGLNGLICDSLIPDPGADLGAQLDKIIEDSQSHAERILLALEGGQP